MWDSQANPTLEKVFSWPLLSKDSEYDDWDQWEWTREWITRLDGENFIVTGALCHNS